MGSSSKNRYQKSPRTTSRYVYLETQKDGVTCELCAQYAGQSWGEGEEIPDEATPPIHPHCRCSLIHSVDDTPTLSIFQMLRESKAQRVESLRVFDSLGWDGKPRGQRHHPLLR